MYKAVCYETGSILIHTSNYDIYDITFLFWAYMYLLIWFVVRNKICGKK